MSSRVSKEYFVMMDYYLYSNDSIALMKHQVILEITEINESNCLETFHSITFVCICVCKIIQRSFIQRKKR